MSFWLHESKIMILLRQIPRWLRFTLSLATIAIISSIWGIFFYYQLYQQHSQLLHKIRNLQLKKDNLEKKLNASQNIAKENAQLEQKIETNYQQALAPNNPIPSLVQKLKKHDLICTEIKPIKQLSTDYCTKYYLHMAVKGSFSNLTAFLDECANKDLCFTTKALTINRLKKNNVSCSLDVKIITKVIT